MPAIRILLGLAALSSAGAPVPALAQGPPAAGTPPLHAPRPQLAPFVAWQHVERGNAAYAASLRSGGPPPPPAARPAGAGRYVCAVLVCSDADFDAAAALGLARSDVFVIATPGPFASPEIAACLDRLVAADRLSLVLVIGHEPCRSLVVPADSDDPLARRARQLAAEAQRRRTSAGGALVQRERELLLAGAEGLSAAIAGDRLRVIPALWEASTGALRWHHLRRDELPLAPVK